MERREGEEREEGKATTTAPFLPSLAIPPRCALASAKGGEFVTVENLDRESRGGNTSVQREGGRKGGREGGRIRRMNE